MISERSKCRFLPLVFILKCFAKKLLIRILKRDNQLHLFRRLEQCREKQVNCETAIQFLKLCQNFNLTPTFARVDQTKANKWRRSANSFEGSIVIEELCLKRKQLAELRLETQDVYNKIRVNCPSLHFLCILETIVTLRNEQYRQSMNGHPRRF